MCLDPAVSSLAQLSLGENLRFTGDILTVQFSSEMVSMRSEKPIIDDLRKSRGLHSVSACGCSAEKARFCWGYSEPVTKMDGYRFLQTNKKGIRNACVRVQELCESRGGRPGLAVLMSLTVSVDVKQH